MEIKLEISKQEVLHEVAQTTNYTGAKMVGDADAYERISTVDEDAGELQRFWNESRAEVAQTFVRLLSSESMIDENTYRLELNVSASFDTALLPSMQLGLFHFFVQNITAKWYVFTNKGEAGAYAERANITLEEVKEKAFFKKKPIRPTYD